MQEKRIPISSRNS